ncbi:hypothetical protein [Hydrogenimonas sp.]
MRHLRGFGKNYFTLAAIQAYSTGVRLHAVDTAFSASPVTAYALADMQEEDPPEVPMPCTCADKGVEQGAKPCHCNCFFRRLAWLLLHLSELRKRPPCRCRYTKTGLAPPSFK